jgi:hypothetical protein
MAGGRQIGIANLMANIRIVAAMVKCELVRNAM